MPYRKLTQGRYSATYPTDLGYLVTPSNFVASSTSRAIIGCHGRGGTGFQYGQPPLEPYVTALVDAGYVVLGVDHARINSWADPDSGRALDDAYAYLQSLGITNTKVGMMGWSMGGGTALNWIKRNESKVACAWLWNPVTDLDFFQSSGYVATYGSLNGVAPGNATYAAEINSVFAPSSAAVGAYTIPASGGSGITITITTGTGKSFADGDNAGQTGLPTAIVNGVSFSYTSRTDSTLIGCLSTTGSTIAVTNAMAITSNYAGQSKGYKLWLEATQWAANGVVIKIAQATDDTTVPPGQNTDATNGFVAKVNSGNVTLRTMTGGHTLGIVNAQVPISEVTAFYQTNLAVA